MDSYPKKIAIFCLSGIGNTILFTPTLRILRKRLPNARFYAVFRNQATSDVLTGSGLVDKAIVFDGNLINKLKLLLHLRNQNFDLSITAFPSNRIEFNLFSWLINARERVTHSYAVGRVRTFAFLQNKKIKADENLHDIFQNLNLLKLLNINFKKEKIELSFFLDKKDKVFSRDFSIKNKLEGKRVIAVHPGTKKKDEIRRWGKDKFIKLINILLRDKKNKIILFKGPDEEDIADFIHEKTGKKAILVENLNLKRVGAIIERCSLFVGTDSGLGHIAAALGVKTLVIFGPANPKRTVPYGGHTAYIRANCPCTPALKYPFWSTSDKIKCSNNLVCLRRLDVKTVLAKINFMLRND